MFPYSHKAPSYILDWVLNTHLVLEKYSFRHKANTFSNTSNIFDIDISINHCGCTFYIIITISLVLIE